MPKRPSRSKRRRDDRRRHQPVGAVRQRNEPCGLCGESRQLTKTHLPPQCAGNTGLVARRRIVTNSTGAAEPSRALTGGLHFFGLCADCNGLASRYDGAYCELVDIVRPSWIRGTAMLPARRYAPPAAQCQPGAAARSILIGMFGLNAHLRVLYPEVAETLLAGNASVILPEEVSLRLAMLRGRRARLSGSIGGIELFGRRLNGQALGVITMAEVYFPPLAWQLAAPEASLLDLEGWPNISYWLGYAPDERLPLDAVCASMPIVLHPKHDPVTGDLWSEMLSDEISQILDCDDVAPSGL